MKIKDIIKDFMIMPQTIKPLGLIHKPGTGPNNRFDFINKGNNRANEDSSDEAYELLGQKDPAIRKYVADLGLQNDQASVNKVVPMIDKARQTTINPSQIPLLKNLANKPADPTALKNILKVKGTPQASEQFVKIMKARDQAEGRSRSYDLGKLINAISTGDYEPPVVLKLQSGNYVIGGRTRLYAALALNKPINVKVLENIGNETKEAPPGTYFTKTGNLVKGRLTKAAKERGARETDPKDSQRSKVPPVTQRNEARGSCWHGYQQKGLKKKGNRMVPNCVKEEAAGVGIVTKQNATKDVPVGGEYMNVKKLGLGKGKPKTMREEFEEFCENFADKKVKGKSRPGRVKRAGASCKGSVSSLRAKAKKYGGERGKMYHWCANMKSGRKKSK